jgi:hypothetical protein
LNSDLRETLLNGSLAVWAVIDQNQLAMSRKDPPIPLKKGEILLSSDQSCGNSLVQDRPRHQQPIRGIAEVLDEKLIRTYVILIPVVVQPQ